MRCMHVGGGGGCRKEMTKLRVLHLPKVIIWRAHSHQTFSYSFTTTQITYSSSSILRLVEINLRQKLETFSPFFAYVVVKLIHYFTYYYTSRLKKLFKIKLVIYCTRSSVSIWMRIKAHSRAAERDVLQSFLKGAHDFKPPS